MSFDPSIFVVFPVRVALVMLLFAAPGVSNLVLYAPLRLAVRACLGLFGMPEGGASL